jgi:hypothetical protein
MDKKALFPISLDSGRFSSNETISALNGIQKSYSEVIFFVADGLQLYNKASELSSEKSLADIIGDFQSNSYYSQRKKWLQSMRQEISSPIGSANWKIANVFDFSDNIFFKIYRNVFVSYISLGKFRSDIIRAAKNHCKKKSEQFSKEELELSIAYIVEEIAINIRIRVIERIHAEYYVGSALTPLVNLYCDHYPIDVFSLAEVQRYNMEFEFYFFEDSDDGPQRWSIIKDMSRQIC